MVSKLDILKKGLVKLKESLKTKKEQLETKLARKESISSSDERWLDNEANTIDEQCILNTLESSSNYEQGLEHLDYLILQVHQQHNLQSQYPCFSQIRLLMQWSKLRQHSMTWCLQGHFKQGIKWILHLSSTQMENLKF